MNMETLDEKLERLYGPQKRKFNSSNYWNEFDDMKLSEAAMALKRLGRPPKDGREMAEILLGHELY